MVWAFNASALNPCGVHLLTDITTSKLRRQKIAHSNFFNWRKRIKERGVELPEALFAPVDIKQEGVHILKTDFPLLPAIEN